MEKYKSEFLNYLQNKRGASVNTILSYDSDLTRFLSYVKAEGVCGIDEINETHILNYVMSLKRSGKSDATAARAVSSVRSFFKFLSDKGYIKKNPACDMRPLKKERKTPDILTEIQITALLNAPDSASLKGFRDAAILELMYATGIRVSELIGLKIYDINTDVGYLNCRDKSGEHRIPIYTIAREKIKDYMDRRCLIPGYDGTDYVFLNMSGQPISRQGVWKLLKTYGKKCGLGFKVTPHIMRNTFAVHLLKNGLDIKDVQNMMGHCEIASTKIYEQALRDRLTESYERCHPRSASAGRKRNKNK